VRLGNRFNLYGKDLWMIAVLPALGGLVVGIIGRTFTAATQGSSIIDVMESVGRASGGIKARSAIEKILTSGITIGTGGSAGAEGPIVTIGAADFLGDRTRVRHRAPAHAHPHRLRNGRRHQRDL
jgi:CIC family chloride channel protein